MRRFAKVSEEEIEEAFFYPSDLVNTKTTIPLRAPVAQLVGHRVVTREVVSSTPTGPTLRVLK